MVKRTMGFANMYVSASVFEEGVAEFLTDWFLVSRLLKLSEHTVFVSNIWIDKT